MFANHGKEDGIPPLTITEIAKHKTKIKFKIHYQQNKDHQIFYLKDAKTPKVDLCFQLIEDIIILYKDEINHPRIFWIGQSVGITIISSTLATHVSKRQ
jgi:hypothetical protein